MAELSLEAFSGGAPAGSSDFPRVSIEEQAQRDREASRIRTAELRPNGGGLLPITAVIPESRAGGKATPSGEMSLEAFAGAASPPPRAGYAFNAEGERKGFVANLKNPLELINRESLPAHLVQAYQRGTLGEIIDRMRAAEPGPPRKGTFGETDEGAVTGRTTPRRRAVGPIGKPTLSEILAEAKKDPGKFAAEFLNSIVADPELLAAPGGLGGKLAGRTVGGRALEAGIVGGGTNVAIEGGKQASTGEFSREDLETAGLVGGVITGPLGALLGKRAGARTAPEPPPRVDPIGPHGGAPSGGYSGPIRRATARLAEDNVIEGEWRRIDEDLKQIGGKAPEERTPAETARLLTFARDWAKENKLTAGAAAALTTYSLFGEDKEAGVTGLALLGAMKAKGGMWHPKAAETLSSPIKDKLISMADIQRQHPEAFDARGTADAATVDRLTAPTDKWADKAASNYLNKHMGTETDPLREIEIPFGEGTRKWGEVTDELVRSDPVKHLLVSRPGMGAVIPEDGLVRALQKNPDEPVWQIDDGREGRIKVDPARTESASALRSYLSHVGDYLRQNVSPSKLPQYDLVRAVRETASNDARVAKDMEKAAAASMKDLPVYKEYPDGMKWVELKLPERLTEEQGKGVRPATPEQLASHLDEDDLPYANKKAQGYVALEGNKPLTSSYTGALATGRTPEEAFLAGQLAREGNQMGHCVGGYCEGVASGESRIFSLRDAKGQSHVTVETIPDAAGKQFINADGIQDLLQDISQIKGKQNRAPSPTYLPYVQDFVKGGKWGEVGDLENTGLHDIEQNGAFLEVAKHFAGERFVPSAEFEAAHDAWANGRPMPPRGGRQAGSIDPALLTRLAAVGLGGLAGATLLDDRPFTGALLGALALTGLGTVAGRIAGKAAITRAAEATDYGLGLLSTRIRNISPRVHHALIDFERRALKRTYDEMEQVTPLMKGLKGDKLNGVILGNDPKAIRAAMKAEGLEPAWDATRTVLNRLGRELNQHGRFKSMLSDYFPRVVKDVPGLMAELGKADRSALETALAAAEKESQAKSGRPLSDIERSVFINQYVLRPSVMSGMPGFAKQRSIPSAMMQQLSKYYYTPAQALYRYVHSAVQDLEKMRLFGKNAVQSTSGGKQYLNIEASIGNMLGEELRAGRLDNKGEIALEQMIKSRFGPGEQAMPGWMQDARNLSNTALLGNFGSALMQIGDTMMTAHHQGAIPTIVAVARVLGRRAPVSAREMGLAGHISEEFGGAPRLTARVQSKAFKLGTFTGIDLLGKNVNLNAALIAAQRQAKTPRGVARLGEDYAASFGPDFPQLIDDLKSGVSTELTDSLLFHELSDAQPISKLETTEALSSHPNFRLLGQLKSFALKQLDIARRDAYQEMKSGRRGRGIRQMASLAALLGLSGMASNAIKDYIHGLDPEINSGQFFENLFKVFGLSEYVRDKMAKGHPMETALGVLGTALPPARVMDDIIRDDPAAIKYLGWPGEMYYYHFGGGKEKEAERREKKREKETAE